MASFLLLSLPLVAGYRRPAGAVGIALAATAASTPFVVWCVSGLENPLSVFLISSLTAVALRMSLRRPAGQRDAVILGLLSFLLFLTRPDGILFVPVLAFLFGLFGERPLRTKALLPSLAFLGPWILVTGGRLIYFGDVLPNTYYAKKGPGWQETLRLIDTLGTTLGGLVFIATVALVITTAVTLAARLGARLATPAHHHSVLLVLGAVFLTAYVVFEALPTDWMPEYRFGTALFLFGPLLLVEFLGRFPVRGQERWRHAGTLVGASLLLVAAGLYSFHHSLDFRQRPTVPFDEVRALSLKLERFAESLGVSRATVLLPDIGGSLWENRFDVLDLAGLTDRTIGRTLRSDRAAFLDYVLSRGPDLVWVHGYWRRLTDFDAASSFTSEYTAFPADSVLEREDGVLYVRNALLASAAARPQSSP